MRRELVCVLMVLVAGCAAAAPTATTGPDGNIGETEGTIGRENGYAYDDPIPVDASDGLNASEQDAVVARQMARLERLRNLEFKRDVGVRVITRAQYQQNRSDGGTNETHARWNDQVWEGLFIVGEDTSVNEAFNSTLGSAVLGYYSAGSGKIIIVSDEAEPVLDKGTLAHELVHALQDQHFGLDDSPPTQDRQLARNGVVEGEASLLEERYLNRCNEGVWNCIETPATGGGGGSGEVNRGLLQVILTPYVQGPDFVTEIEQRGGWDAVDALHEDYPASTEQIIDPSKYPDEKPVNVTVPDESNDDWNRFDHDPVADTLGQASIHVMFFDNNVQTGDVAPYGYAHPAADGWEGDSIVPYHNGNRYGYVWVTVWENENEAGEFADAYRALLKSEGAQFRDGGVAVIPEVSPFGDAFRVTREGNRVRIVNGPSVGSLSAIHGE